MNKVFSGLFKKLRSIKHIEIILAVLFGLIILLVYFSTTSSVSSSKNNIRASSEVLVYINEVEQKLENLLAKIDGVGKVKVMIMCDSNIELDPDIVPEITSVVVVASGATDTWVKLDIIKAVQALLTVKSANIEVLPGG